MSRSLRVAAAVTVFTLALGACGHVEYRYTPPSTPNGERCIAKCANKQNACMVGEQENASFFVECEREADHDYNACVQVRGRNACHKRICYDDIGTRDCDADYRGCYGKCGGRVEEREVR